MDIITTFTRLIEERCAIKFPSDLNAEDVLTQAATGKPHINELRQSLNFHDDFIFNGLSLEAQRCYKPSSE